MKRGSIIVGRSERGVATKARPCVIVQRNEAISSGKLTVCPLTSRIDAENLLRPVLVPTAANGLVQISQVEVDWVLTEHADLFGAVIGFVEPAFMDTIDTALRRWLAL